MVNYIIEQNTQTLLVIYHHLISTISTCINTSIFWTKLQQEICIKYKKNISIVPTTISSFQLKIKSTINPWCNIPLILQCHYGEKGVKFCDGAFEGSSAFRLLHLFLPPCGSQKLRVKSAKKHLKALPPSAFRTSTFRPSDVRNWELKVRRCKIPIAP